MRAIVKIGIVILIALLFISVAITYGYQTNKVPSTKATTHKIIKPTAIPIYKLGAFDPNYSTI